MQSPPSSSGCCVGDFGSFDPANYLRDEEDVAEYLRQVLQEGDPSELGAALGDIARARSMSQLARDAGLSRESLYKSLSGERAPSSETLFKVMKALGFRLKTEPLWQTFDPKDTPELGAESFKAAKRMVGAKEVSEADFQAAKKGMGRPPVVGKVKISRGISEHKA